MVKKPINGLRGGIVYLRAWRSAAIALMLAACAVTSDTSNELARLSPDLHDEIELWTVDVEAVRAMVPQGLPFNQGLREEYLRLAEAQTSPLESLDFRHFLRKAVASAQGFQVLPDQAGFRELDAETSELFAERREHLLSMLDSSSRRDEPMAASAAQVAFDCWLAYEARGDQAGVMRCRGDFETALDELRPVSISGMTSQFIVLFAWDRSELSQGGATVLKAATDAFRAGDAVRIVISGHADRSREESHNLQLSRLRAETVRAGLVAERVPEEAIAAEWFGETQPRVLTEDGVREPENRRIEILFR